MNFVADRVVEVVVRDLAILINVELGVNLLELLVAHLEAPVIEVEADFAGTYAVGVNVLVHVFECLRNCFPLLPHLVDDEILQLLVVHFLRGVDQVILQVPCSLQVFLVLWVSLGVVPEVEAGTLVDAVAEPRAEVLVVNTTHLILATLSH